MKTLKDRRNIFWIVAGVAAAGLIFLASRTPAPPDPYLNRAPPPGPNARPDALNPAKGKKLPRALMARPAPGPAVIQTHQAD